MALDHRDCPGNDGTISIQNSTDVMRHRKTSAYSCLPRVRRYLKGIGCDHLFRRWSIESVLNGAPRRTPFHTVTAMIALAGVRRLLAHQDGQNFLRTLRNIGSRSKYGRRPRLVQIFVILLRNDASDDHLDVAAALFLESDHYLRDQRLVTGSQCRYADNVDVILNCVTRDFCRRREERPYVNIEPDIRECGGDHLSSPVMAVLARLCDQDART